MTIFLRKTKETIKHWFAPAVIGSISMIIGIYIFTIPLETYSTLTTLFSLSFLAPGILEIFFSIQNRNEIDGLTWYLTGGLFNATIGILLLSGSEIIALVLPFMVGFTLFFRAIQGIRFALVLKKHSSFVENTLAIVNSSTIAFSVILMLNPLFTETSLVVITALTFFLSGIGGVVLSVQLRKLKMSLPNKSEPPF